jgi:hypothetical protein
MCSGVPSTAKLLVVDITAGVIIDPATLDFDLEFKSDGTAGIEHILAEYNADFSTT